MNIPFKDEELNTAYTIKSRRAGRPDIPVYSFPLTPKEGAREAFLRRPVWELTDVEVNYFSPRVIPDSAARAYVIDGGDMSALPQGGGDMFGIQWEYVPQVRGSMVRPGAPLLSDANEWQEKLHFPDIDSWDWESCRRENAAYLDNGRFNLVFFMNGWFERLVSFMDFGGAAVALIDESQMGAVKALMERLSELYIAIFDRLFEYLPMLDGAYMHDDWGSQRAPLFSPDTAQEMIAPAMRRFTDHVHALGKFCEIHSCGKNELMTPAYIAGGWDSWCGQTINDTAMVYERYGERILVGVAPEPLPEGASEEEIIAAARAFADKYCRPEKPSRLIAAEALDPRFRAELYRRARINYGRG